jgi:PAS domain S-box-containing protein
MSWIDLIQPFFLFGSAIITVAVGVYCLSRRNIPAAVYLAWVMLPVTIWAVSTGFLFLSQNEIEGRFWGQVVFTALAFLPAVTWIFVVHFTGHQNWLSRGNLVALFIVPITTTLVIWTNFIHHWFIRENALMGGWQPGFWFWIYAGYCFLVVIAMIYILIRTAIRSPQPYRGQVLIILGWTGISLVFVAAASLGISNPLINSLPLLLPVLNSLGFAWAVFRFRLFDLAPIARETLVENMNDAMLVLDRQGRVVDANPAWERLAQVSKSGIIGQPVGQLPTPWNELAGRIYGTNPTDKEMVLNQVAERRSLHLQIAPLHGRGGNQGYLLVFHDLMTQKLMESMEERVAARTRDLSTLYEVASRINRSNDLPSILEGCLTQLMKATGCEAGAIFSGAGSAALPQVIMQKGISEADLAGLKSSPLWKQIAEKGLPLLTHQRDLDQQVGRFLPHDFSFQSLMAAPILLRENNEDHGLLTVFAVSPHHFNIEDLGLLVTIAEQISLAVENDRLRRQARSTAITDERNRLARDLHDSIAQTLYSQILFATAAQKQVRLSNVSHALEYLDRLSSVARQALREMRLLIYELRPPELQGASLEERVLHRLEMVEQRAGLTTRLGGEWNHSLPAPLQDALYRITEEALNNTLKHANASEVVISFSQGKAEFSLEIGDNGCGFDPKEARTGMGIKNLHERAAQLGGVLEIISSEGCGTRVRARFSTAQVDPGTRGQEISL